MLLTKSTTFIIGPIASILGYIMNAIFWLQEQIGIANIGLCIILFTIVIYVILTPLTIQQQKFSRLSSRMNPELQAIQKKYKGKNQDQAAMMKMNEETQAVYAKYGVNPMGSCVQLLIQMPILFALYRVIWNIPAYVTSVKDAFMPLAQKLMDLSGAEKFMTEIAKSTGVAFKEMTENTLIDVLYKFKPDNWAALADKFPDISDIVMDTQKTVDHMNYFLGLNIADAPLQIFMRAISAGAILLAIGAALIPILSAVSQWMNTKLMTVSTNTQAPQKKEQNSMDSTMKMMNNVMPIMSAVFCLTLPVGMGIYWIAGAVIRCIQQLIINKKMDSMDLDELVKQNLEKINKKRAKQGLPPQKITNTAKINTKHIERPEISAEEKQEKIKKSTDYYKNTSTAKPGSLASKAQMVKQYNERNARK
ncbi:YidC/Oxa1 family membrane protein insertase [Parablautia sp. Marseille-Q6255]|uniref:YidC/Oxa1 family membrane protein insertase n=1 Tax=Parablautia sp. Marseille-Q6255 TaxID=3039593 RepID=UPI0024BC4B0A|nr:YidC/Oxa1 family membrane protein insertase [Parablautia sp. Marseille-Q6255]